MRVERSGEYEADAMPNQVSSAEEREESSSQDNTSVERGFMNDFGYRLERRSAVRIRLETHYCRCLAAVDLYGRQHTPIESLPVIVRLLKTNIEHVVLTSVFVNETNVPRCRIVQDSS